MSIITAANYWNLIGLQLYKKLANQTINNSSVLTDDTELQGISLVPFSHYLVEMGLIYESGTVPDLLIRLQSDVSVNLIGRLQYESAIGTGSVADLFDRSNTIIIDSAIGGSGGGVTVQCKASVLIRTLVDAATIKLRWCQNVADASDSIMKAGSFISVLKYP